MKKTNALRLLDRAGILYRTLEYDAPDGPLDASAVAAKIGLPPEQVFKTLVGIGDRAEHAVFVIPGNCELDLRRAAKAAGHKKVELIAVRDLLRVTGYVRGGCSPIGMKQAIPTFIDESCGLFDEIAVSAGVIGLQVILASEDIIQLADARTADLIG